MKKNHRLAELLQSYETEHRDRLDEFMVRTFQ